MDGTDEAFQPENTITTAELLKAWTIGGQTNLGMDDCLGTLEEGKLADIANLVKIDAKEAKNAKVVMTIMDGQVVYK